MNQVILVGRTTDSPELKVTQSGKSVINMSIAVKRPFSKDVTDFFQCVAWEKNAEFISRYVNKGDKIGINGVLATRSWTNQDGEKRTSVEILINSVELLSTNNKSDTEPQFNNNSPNFEEIKTDDDLPF